jgi:hypothetical protein
MIPTRRITDALNDLLSARAACDALPIAPVEPPMVLLSSNTESGLGFVLAPSCPPASMLSFGCLNARVPRRGTASFVLALPSDRSCDESCMLELEAISSVATVEATIVSPFIEGAMPTSLELLPATYEPWPARGWVLVSVLAPASVPRSSYIRILRACVGGVDVELGDTPVRVPVGGFNHARGTDMRAYTAAHDGDVASLLRALERGASTEGASPWVGDFWACTMLSCPLSEHFCTAALWICYPCVMLIALCRAG